MSSSVAEGGYRWQETMIERQHALGARTLANTDDDDLLTLQEVAEILRCSEWTVRRRALKTNLLKPSLHMGRLPLFRRADVVQFIKDQTRNRFASLPRPPRKRRRS